MQLLQSRKTSPRQKLKRRLIWIGIAVVAGGAWLSLDFGRDRYHVWKQARALKQAKAFVEKHDAQNAQIALEVALTAVPGNPETIRVAADMLEQVGAAQAMRLRRAVVQVAPDSAEDAAKLVYACLKFRDFNAAKDALASTPPSVSVQLPMLQAALAYALTTDDAPVADYLFQQLKAQSPKNEDLRHAHALLLLRHPRKEQREAARHELEELAKSDSRLTMQINREFVGYALQLRNYDEANRYLALLLAPPEALLQDRLQKANLDLLIKKIPFEMVYPQLAPIAGKTEADAVQFVQWLLVQNRAKEADRWINGLPQPIRHSSALFTVEAEIAAQLKDWDRLAVLLQAGAWGPITKETLRLALAAQTVDSPNKPALRHDTWDMALASAGGNLATLRILQRLAAFWAWDEETERTLWTVARMFPDQTWAHQALFNFYREKKNTIAMRDVMNTLRESDGTVPRYQHDWALLTLVTEPNANWNPAKETMRQLYEGTPANATYATGYAFALAQAGKGAEALAVVQKIPAAERDYFPRQPYLAFVYGVARRAADLEHAASIGQRATYLPEESYLFTRAREEATRKLEKPKAAKPGEGAAAPKP